VIGCFFLAFQGHRVTLASLLAYPGSALPLQLLSLTTGEENAKLTGGKVTLNSLYSLFALDGFILHFVHSDFGNASFLALIWEQFCPSSVSLH